MTSAAHFPNVGQHEGDICRASAHTRQTLVARTQPKYADPLLRLDRPPIPCCWEESMQAGQRAAAVATTPAREGASAPRRIRHDVTLALWPGDLRDASTPPLALPGLKRIEGQSCRMTEWDEGIRAANLRMFGAKPSDHGTAGEGCEPSEMKNWRWSRSSTTWVAGAAAAKASSPQR
jgi:hypothetical protein